MNSLTYEAVVVTDDGTYRAYRLTEASVCVTEDGTDGIVDVIHLDEIEAALWAPETLIPTLISWIYEMRRGLGIVSANLASRRD